MSDSIAIIGYSGHAYVVADAAILTGLSLRYYCDKMPLARNPFGYEYLGDENAEDFKGWNGQYEFILGIGDNHIRERVAKLIQAKGCLMHNVLHPDSSVSPFFQMGSGNFIGRNAAVNAFAKIGDCCILNTGSIVEHDCLIGNYVHIAPGAVLTGNVCVGDYSFIGANAVIKQGVKIGAHVTIGAGAVIIKDVPDLVTVIGNPGIIR